MDPIDEGLRALVPPGTADVDGWLQAFAAEIDGGAPTVARIGVVSMDQAALDTAKSALVDWADTQAQDDPARKALARGFVLWLLRPALRLAVNEGRVAADRPAQPAWGTYTDAIQRVAGDWSPSVARIDLERENGTRAVAGTGWVVGETADAWILLTARHVTRDLAAAGWKAGGPRALADFGVLDAPGAALPLRLTAREHPSLDLACVELPKAGAPALAPFPLAAAPSSEGDAIVAVGHGILQHEAFAVEIVGFDKQSGVKRASPGFLRPPRVPAPTGGWQGVVAHDATTLGGNSGGPVVNLKTGEIVGAHVGGQPVLPGVNTWFLANFALPTVAEAVADLLDGVTLPPRGPLWT